MNTDVPECCMTQMEMSSSTKVSSIGLYESAQCGDRQL